MLLRTGAPVEPIESLPLGPEPEVAGGILRDHLHHGGGDAGTSSYRMANEASPGGVESTQTAGTNPDRSAAIAVDHADGVAADRSGVFGTVAKGLDRSAVRVESDDPRCPRTDPER